MENEEKTNGAVAPAVPETLVPPAAQTPKIAGQMTETERVRAENIGLRTENLALLTERHQREALDLQETKRALQADAAKLRTEIAQRLNLHPDKVLLRSNGTIEERQ